MDDIIFSYEKQKFRLWKGQNGSYYMGFVNGRFSMQSIIRWPFQSHISAIRRACRAHIRKYTPNKNKKYLSYAAAARKLDGE